MGWVLAGMTGLAFILAACQSMSPVVSTATPNPTNTVQVPTTASTAAPTTVAATQVPITLKDGKTTASGLQYLEETPGTGAVPQSGNIITMNYIATLPDGTELGNTYTGGGPVSTVWGKKLLLPGWEEGIGLMKVGGKTKFVLPPSLALGAEGSGAIPPNSQIVLEVELLAAKPSPSPTAVTADQLTKTASGLQYFDIEKGSGVEALKNSTVATDYTIWVKTDSGYDYIASSEGSTPISFVIGRGDTVFPGWEEGATGMKVGGKRLLVIPADLGMGATGNGSTIPANATLVLEIQLKTSHEPQVPTKVDEKDFTTTTSGLKYHDFKVGEGATPTAGQTVEVHYTGWLEDGTQFDSSLDRGEPISFALGQGNVIPGWDEGISTMKVGGKRQMVIPANLAYGDTGAGTVIPPGATLVFEVELVSINPK
jgi:peptidylprolyl isomerase